MLVHPENLAADAVYDPAYAVYSRLYTLEQMHCMMWQLHLTLVYNMCQSSLCKSKAHPMLRLQGA